MSQLWQALSFACYSIYWAMSLPWAGWFTISHWYEGPGRHICLLSSAALETPFNDVSYTLFFPQKLQSAVHAHSVCALSLPGAGNPSKYLGAASGSGLEKFGQISEVCLSCLHRLAHGKMLAQLRGLD